MPPPPKYNVELAEFFSTFAWVGTDALNIVFGGGGHGARSMTYQLSASILDFGLAKFFLPPLRLVELAFSVLRFAWGALKTDVASKRERSQAPSSHA